MGQRKNPFRGRKDWIKDTVGQPSFALNLEGKALKIASNTILCSRKIPKKERRPDED